MDFTSRNVSCSAWLDKQQNGGNYLPDDEVEFLLTMREEDRKDWSKLKKAILTEYRTDVATAEQAFLTRNRQPGESFLVNSAVLECLYRQA